MHNNACKLNILALYSSGSLMKLLESCFKQQIIIRSIPISTAATALMEGTLARKPHCILVDEPSAPNRV